MCDFLTPWDHAERTVLVLKVFLFQESFGSSGMCVHVREPGVCNSEVCIRQVPQY